MVLVELPGLTCHWGEVSDCCVKRWPLRLQREGTALSGIMRAEKGVFYKQSLHREREGGGGV